MKKLRRRGVQAAVFGVIGGARVLCGPAVAQNLEAQPLITDRPDFTESPQTVERGRFQLEGGVTFTDSGGVRQSDYGELLIRAGLNERAELRIGVPTYTRIRGGGMDASGWSDVYLGAKFALSAGSGQTGWRKPAIGLLIGTTVPTGSRAMRANYQPEAILALGIDLSERVSLGTNVGIASNHDGQRFTTLSGSVALGLGVSERTGVFAEIYGLNKADSAGNRAKYFNGGVTYLLNDDLQLDARAGTGLGNNVPGSDYFFGVGASQRF